MLSFDTYIDGLVKFSRIFKGKLVTETMLVKGVNDNSELVQKNASLIKKLNPVTAYLSIPIRPPALSLTEKPNEAAINLAYQVYLKEGIAVELLLGFEGVDTGFTGNAIDDIVNICTVHPIRQDTMDELLMKDHADALVLDVLMQGNHIKKVHYDGYTYYVRQFNM